MAFAPAREHAARGWSKPLAISLLAVGLVASTLSLARLQRPARHRVTHLAEASIRAEHGQPNAAGVLPATPRATRSSLPLEPAPGSLAGTPAREASGRGPGSDDETLLHVSVLDPGGAPIEEGTLDCVASEYPRAELGQTLCRSTELVRERVTAIRLPASCRGAILTFSAPGRPCFLVRVTDLRVVDGVFQLHGLHVQDVCMRASPVPRGPTLRGAIRLDGVSEVPPGISIVYTPRSEPVSGRPAAAASLLPRLARIDRYSRTYEIDLAPGCWGALWTSGDEIVPQGAYLLAPEDDLAEVSHDLELETGGLLDLQMVDGDVGHPLVGLAITVDFDVAEGTEGKRAHSRIVSRPAETDSLGRVHLDHVPRRGPIAIRAPAPPKQELVTCLETSGEELWKGLGKDQTPFLIVPVGAAPEETGNIQGSVSSLQGLPPEPRLDVVCSRVHEDGAEILLRAEPDENQDWAFAAIPQGVYDLWLQRGSQPVSESMRVRLQGNRNLAGIRLVELERPPIELRWRGAEERDRLDLEALDMKQDPMEPVTLGAPSGTLALDLGTHRILQATLERSSGVRSTRVIEVDPLRDRSIDLDFTGDRLRPIVLDVEGAPGFTAAFADLTLLGERTGPSILRTRVRIEANSAAVCCLPDGEYFFRIESDDPLCVVAGIVRVSVSAGASEVRLHCRLGGGPRLEEGTTLELLGFDGVSIEALVPKSLRRFGAGSSGPLALTASNEDRRWFCPLGSGWSLSR